MPLIPHVMANLGKILIGAGMTTAFAGAALGFGARLIAENISPELDENKLTQYGLITALAGTYAFIAGRLITDSSENKRNPASGEFYNGNEKR